MIPVYSIVAYSGVGKTTLLEKLIPELKKRGARVAVIKHDAHDFEVDREGKDTWRLTKAGADMTLISNDRHAAIMENRPADMDTLISMIHDVDLILTEGYKHGRSTKKIALYRSATGKGLPESDTPFFAVMSDIPFCAQVPWLELDDAESLAEMIMKDMKKEPSAF